MKIIVRILVLFGLFFNIVWGSYSTEKDANVIVQNFKNQDNSKEYQEIELSFYKNINWENLKINGKYPQWAPIVGDYMNGSGANYYTAGGFYFDTNFGGAKFCIFNGKPVVCSKETIYYWVYTVPDGANNYIGNTAYYYHDVYTSTSSSAPKVSSEQKLVASGSYTRFFTTSGSCTSRPNCIIYSDSSAVSYGSSLDELCNTYLRSDETAVWHSKYGCLYVENITCPDGQKVGLLSPNEGKCIVDEASKCKVTEKWDSDRNKCVVPCVDSDLGIGIEQEDGKCYYCAFGGIMNEETGICSNAQCFDVGGKHERFDCICRAGMNGAGSSFKAIQSGAGTDCTITCENGTTISTISNFNPYTAVFSGISIIKYGNGKIKNSTDFCTLDDSSQTIEVEIVPDDDQGGESQGGGQEGGGSQGGESQGGGQEGGGSQGGESQGGGQEGGGSQGGGSATSGSYIDFGNGKIVPLTKNDDKEAKYTDPDTGNDVTINKENNTVTVTDNVSGESKTTGSTSNGSSISYTDPFTGQQTNVNINNSSSGSSDTNDKENQGKDGEDGEFVGPNLGGLGNASDFDKNLEITALSDNLNSLQDEGFSFGQGLLDEGSQALGNIKGSIDSLTEKLAGLGKNPFKSGATFSCPLTAVIIEKPITIDICQFTSQYRNLVYSVLFVGLNLVIFFGFIKILMLAFAGFASL